MAEIVSPSDAANFRSLRAKRSLKTNKGEHPFFVSEA
jgi:hypothetical protein